MPGGRRWDQLFISHPKFVLMIDTKLEWKEAATRW
jgi:hypothetical protein